MKSPRSLDGHPKKVSDSHNNKKYLAIYSTTLIRPGSVGVWAINRAYVGIFMMLQCINGERGEMFHRDKTLHTQVPKEPVSCI